jgi:deoxyribodipyrimidine photo-lyase
MYRFPVLYDEVLDRIDSINPVVYANTRNFVDGAVSYLSPYISRGAISLTQVRDAVLSKGYKNHQVEKFLQELSWREYFQRVWQAKNTLIESDLKQAQTRVLHWQMIKAIQNAASGIDAVDTAINKLYSTGYMHNHLRMYTASIACNIARAHWKQPARWLYYHLLDGDIASNNCSWQWVAGSFSSKKYFCNQENINKYTKANQTNTFLDKGYEALLESGVPAHLLETSDQYLKTTLPHTTLPIIDDSRPTLIYNSYNLDPLWKKDENVNRILLLEPSHFEKYPVSENVIEFIISVANNINDIQIFCGEFNDLQVLYKEKQQARFIYKEHPAFSHYKGMQEERSWMFEEVKGYYPSFFSYWKKCEQYLKL